MCRKVLQQEVILMYDLTFNLTTLKDLVNHRDTGRQVYCAIVVPFSGIFTDKSQGSSATLPRIVCPYQVNDIIAIQEKWARAGTSYVYGTDYSSGSGYNFRPASTMPVSAARMHARIVSIRTWTLTQDIVDNYLSIGYSPDYYAGTAKVIGYYDRGNALLSNIRKNRNKEVLAKTYQPSVSNTLPLVVNKYVPYYLREPVNYATNTGKVTSSRAQAYEGGKLKNGQLYDPLHRRWSQFVSDTSTYPGKEFVGELAWSKPEKPAYLFYNLDENGNRIPVYATYKAQVVDPEKHLFAWLISAYLCDADGEIIGNWFGKKT